MGSIYESYVDNNYDDKSISMDALEEIWGKNYVHPNINVKDSILKICDHIRQVQSQWKGAEISEKLWAKVYTRS